MITWMGST
jgi:hypothetical protein